MARGFAAAAAELRRPLAGQHVLVVEGFVYFGIDIPSSPERLRELEAAYQQQIAPRIDRALHTWTSQYLPEAERINRELWECARAGGSGGALAAMLDRAVDLRAQQWRIHDLALVPAMAAAARFTERYADQIGGPLRAQLLLQGFPNRATEAAEALDQLAEDLRKRPALAEALRTGAVRPGRMPRSADGLWFASALARYLDRFGHRSGAWDVGDATWIERPRPVFALLRDRLQGPSGPSGARRRAAAETRERACTTALLTLPTEQHPDFLCLLTAAQAYPVVSEDHNAVIDQEGMAALRAILLDVGRALVLSGRLVRATDIVWLTHEEMRRSLHGSLDPRPLVPPRRRQRSRQRGRHPAMTLGRPLPPWAADNPTLTDFFGLRAEASAGAFRLHGSGVSPGTATGRARVISGLEQIDRLQPGDILVCPMTSPAWTPWLGVIAGAVVETGGMLSHTAVLAREFGVPCVTGVRGATTTIADGSLIELDGSAGTITWR